MRKQAGCSEGSGLQLQKGLGFKVAALRIALRNRSRRRSRRRVGVEVGVGVGVGVRVGGGGGTYRRQYCCSLNISIVAVALAEE